MPRAIQLTRATIDLISETLGIDKQLVSDVWQREILWRTEPYAVYYVQDVLYNHATLPYLIYSEREFLEDFASVPDGIDTRFVKVTQVKS